ncbi:hypothetical protein Rsub_06122 [Raphidocelis subcapitata]|uniref:Uncharacterized protein n=1 Tax=Raphidocelis subcapitata TaxID=307507 RepID=A0A2V0P7G6_9CHLO|nr:hypothetical protein Rsub_06122 [Raphidocelis subcapitata]|eukprot:GBF93790.1 hypothetical protein Rsub_06122 [Raphidocelis subcapitata]
MLSSGALGPAAAAGAAAACAPLPGGLNPIWLAQSKLRRRRFDEAIEICSAALAAKPYDQAAWYLKARALTLKNWLDDSEIEEEGIGDALLEEAGTAQVARPGTSLARPSGGANAPSSSGGGSSSPAVRPVSHAGRPLTGFARPGTSTRPGTGARPGTTGGAAAVQAALRGGGKPGTARPVTSSGRFVRLGTASLASEPGGPFINAGRLDLRKYAARPNLARVLCDYLLHVDNDARRALELAAAATQAAGFEDWWWKARLGEAYGRLGLLRDAAQQLASSLRNQDMVSTALALGRVHQRLDQPAAALALYADAAARQPWEPGLLLAAARVKDAMGQGEEALGLYQQVLAMDASSVEAIACLGAHHFYSDQPELALRHFRRLLQMGVASAELWANVGLACFAAGQYDLALPAMERALAAADDGAAPEVWYNVGQIATGIGDTSWAAQCFRLAVSLDPTHAEAWNNLAVLEARRGSEARARAYLRTARAAGPGAYEAHFNAALLAWRRGELQEAWGAVNAGLAAFGAHPEGLELRRLIRAQLTAL